LVLQTTNGHAGSSSSGDRGDIFLSCENESSKEDDIISKEIGFGISYSFVSNLDVLKMTRSKALGLLST